MARTIKTHRNRNRNRPEQRADGTPAAAGPPSRPRRPYDRDAELPRILPLWPHEVEDDTPQGRARIVVRLRRALRAERRRGISGHWTYDLARHAELLRVYRLELAALGARFPARARDGDT
jgi:hypothetical protein